jgi:orotidine-5'-phosphate decarboxylase
VTLTPTSLNRARECVILALDFPAPDHCFLFLDALEAGLPARNGPIWLKVGLELYLASGPNVLDRLQTRGYRIFLDLKLHDIPNTVAGAIRAVLPLSPDLLTIHAGGGVAMLRASADAVAGTSTRLLAVTVLTSIDGAQLSDLGIAASPAQHVERLAVLAYAAGIDGLVCSPQEAPALRSLLPGSHLVTPGIRPDGIATGDQRRVSTPAAALMAGANQIVVGRPVTTAANPAAAWIAILEQVASVRAS